MKILLIVLGISCALATHGQELKNSKKIYKDMQKLFPNLEQTFNEHSQFMIYDLRCTSGYRNGKMVKNRPGICNVRAEANKGTNQAIFHIRVPKFMQRFFKNGISPEIKPNEIRIHLKNLICYKFDRSDYICALK